MPTDPSSRPPLDSTLLTTAAAHPAWWRVEVVDEAGSTNAVVAARAQAGEQHGLVVVAEHQTAGRGRLSRVWETPPRAALTFSVLVRPGEADGAAWPLLPLLTGVAVVDGIAAAGGPTCGLKWPNDVVHEDLKVAGLLAERVDTPTGPAAVLGIGLNVTTTEAELPVPTATSLLLVAGRAPSREDLLLAVLDRLGALLDSYERGHPSELVDLYRARCVTLGRQVARRPARRRDRRGHRHAGGRRRRAGPRRRRHRATRQCRRCRAPARRAVMGHDDPVAINPKLLNEGEHVVLSTRTHVKALIGPFLILLVVVFLSAFLGAKVKDSVDNDSARTVLGIVVGVVAAVVVVWWVIRPFVLWWTTTYTFTNRRFIERSGFIAKEGRTIPLNRISGVDFEMGVIDRVFGCGTLVVSDASEQGRVPLHDIPRVEQAQKVVAEELHRLTQRDRPSDDGT